MNGRRVLITGAGGFVGGALARGFADLGWEVVGVDVAFDGGSGDHHMRCVEADLEERVPQEVGSVDLVIHGAWLTTDPEGLEISPREYHRRNIAALTSVLRFTLAEDPAAFVFLSSTGVFGPDDGDEGLRDGHEPTGDSSYARAKRLGETLAMDGVNTDVTVAHVVRLGYLFGPGEVSRPSRRTVSLVARWLAAARGGRPIEVRSDDPLRDWTFAPDLAAALARIVGAPAAGHPIHVGSPRVCRDSELSASIASGFPGAEIVRVSGRGRTKPPMIPSDVPALRGFAWTEVAAGVGALITEDGHTPAGEVGGGRVG